MNVRKFDEIEATVLIIFASREENGASQVNRERGKIAIFLSSAIKFSDAESRDYYLSRSSELVNCDPTPIYNRRTPDHFFSINRRCSLLAEAVIGPDRSHKVDNPS